MTTPAIVPDNKPPPPSYLCALPAIVLFILHSLGDAGRLLLRG